MTRRTAIKWLHWISLALILYFWAVEPEDVERLGAAALATHAGVGLVLAIVVLGWFGMYLVKGLAGRAGPKLPGWARRVHPIIHKGLHWLLVAMMATGGLIGLFAPYMILAFGVIPFVPNLDIKSLWDLMEELHELVFDLLLIAIFAHAFFHIWRHFWVRDNALRIMVPKALHRFL